MSKKVLVTGASGFLVGNLLRFWIGETCENGTNFRALIREKSVDRAKKGFIGYTPGNPKIIVGDVTDPRVLKYPKDYDEVIEEVDTIIHGAGSVSFDNNDRAILEATNIGGTDNIIDLARHLNRLERFYFISTTHIGGITNETLSEDSLPPRSPRGFRSVYESTKWAAERKVRESGLPYVILRPGALLGSSRPPYDTLGETGTMYGFLRGLGLGFRKQFGRRFLEGLTNGNRPLEVSLRLPGYADRTTLNFSCCDDVVKTIIAIANNPPSARGYNLNNPKNLRGQDICDAIETAFNIRGVIPAESDTIDHPNPLEEAIMSKANEFYGYMIGQAPNCQTENTQKAIAGSHSRVEMTPPLFTAMMRQYVLNEIA